MGTAQESVLGIVIDVCTRSFLLLSDEGNEKEVHYENTFGHGHSRAFPPPVTGEC